jgi:hypothetical protein
MKLADMKAFAALTDEERAVAIRREELRQQAIREYDEEWFNPDKYGSERPVCGCGESYWSLDKDGQEALNICFDSDGKIGSDMWESVQMCNLYCIHCGSKPKAPQRYIDEYIAAEMEVDE